MQLFKLFKDNQCKLTESRSKQFLKHQKKSLTKSYEMTRVEIKADMGRNQVGTKNNFDPCHFEAWTLYDFC